MKLSYLNTNLLLLAFLGGIIVCSAANNATKELCHPHDKRALLRIKQQTNNVVDIFNTWDPATDCCNWSPLRCDFTTNRVNFLVLIGSNNKSTPFPSALGDLPYLDTLYVQNNFAGPIPVSLSKLRRLTYLDINSNHLSSPIPSFFGTLPILSKLYLSNNFLTGPIPPSLGLSRSLTYLDLSANNLTGPIPSTLALAPSLSNIVLDNNKLSGAIPESLGSFNTGQLIALSAANNSLSGEIPRSLKNGSFWNLDLSGNKLVGDPSFLFSKDMIDMAFLDLSDNSFSFDMTNLTFTRRLAGLGLAHNKIYGSLPEGLADLPDFNFFDVSYNRLCGRIPGGALTKFNQTSYIHNKCLCGTPLPACK